VLLGAVVLVALGAAVAAMLALEGRHLRPGIELEVELERTGALQVGAGVKLAGLTVGSVDDIRLQPAPAGSEERTHALLVVWIDARHRHLVRETTDFFFNQEGLLGDAYLGIAERPGEPGPPLAAGARVSGVAPPQIDKLLGTSYRNLQAITELLREGIPEIDQLTRALEELERTVKGLPPSGPAWSSALRLVEEARALGDGVPPGAATALAGRAKELGRRQAAALAPLAHKLEVLGREAERLAAALHDPRARHLAAALNDTSRLVQRVDEGLTAAQSLMALVARGEGTIGAFLQDVELADELKAITRTLKRKPWLTLGRR
jgi:ABC-type transporter Mla subunit MlaD